MTRFEFFLLIESPFTKVNVNNKKTFSLKTPFRVHEFLNKHTVAPCCPGAPGIPASPATPYKRITTISVLLPMYL